jgi:hypothetical protein
VSERGVVWCGTERETAPQITEYDVALKHMEERERVGVCPVVKVSTVDPHVEAKNGGSRG